ncbi:hypothetical protein Ancab_023417 [Ancistrocladus abbreviatus]
MFYIEPDEKRKEFRSLCSAREHIENKYGPQDWTAYDNKEPRSTRKASTTSKRTGSKTATVATATATGGKALDDAGQTDTTDERASSGSGASDSLAPKTDGKSGPTSLDKGKSKRDD